MMTLLQVVNYDIWPMKKIYNLEKIYNPRHYSSCRKTIKRNNCKDSYGEKLIQGEKLWHKNDTRKNYFGGMFSLQASIPSSRCYEDASKILKVPNYFHQNHRNKHDPSAIFYNIEEVNTTAKSRVNVQWQCLCSEKNIFDAFGFRVGS